MSNNQRPTSKAKPARSLLAILFHEKAISIAALVLSIPALVYGCRADRLASRIAQTHLAPRLVAKWGPSLGQRGGIILVNQGPVEIKSLRADCIAYTFPSGFEATNRYTNIYASFVRDGLTDATLLKASLAIEENAQVNVPIVTFPGAEDTVVRLRATYYRASDMERFTSVYDFLLTKGSVVGPNTDELGPRYEPIKRAVDNFRHSSLSLPER